MKVKFFQLATKIRTGRRSHVRTEGTEVVSNEEVDDPGGPPRRKLSTRIKNLFKRADRYPVGEDVLQENLNHPNPNSLFRRLNFKRSRVPAVLIGTPQLAERIPSTDVLNDRTSVIPLSENRHGHSPPIPLGEGAIAGPSTLPPPLKTSFTESDEDRDECESVYYTMADSASLLSSNANGSVQEDVEALGHRHDNADEEVIASPDTYSLTGDPHTSRAPLLIPEPPIGLISETPDGSTSPASSSPASQQPLRPRQQTWASSRSSYFSLSRSTTEEYTSLSRSQTEDRSSSSRSQTDDYVSLSRSQDEENSSLSRSQTGGSSSQLFQFTNVKGLTPNRSSSSDACAGSLSQSINDVLPAELIMWVLSLCLRLPIGCFDGALWRRITRTCYQLRLVCSKWNNLIVSAHLMISSVLPSSLSPCVLPPSEVLLWYKEQIARKSVFDNLSLSVRQDCRATGCRYWGPYHLDLTSLRMLSSAIPKCRGLKVFFPRSFVADWLQADDNATTTATEVTIPMSFATPNLRYLSWTFNLPLSAPIPPEFEFPWFALRHVQHGLTWSLLTSVELDCPLTIEDCLFVLSEGQENLERVSFRTVDGLGGEWTSTITLPRLDSLSVEGIGDLGLLFSFLEMERHRRLGITSHTREGELCEPTPSLHALNVHWDSLTHVDLYCHLTTSDLVSLMCGLFNIVSFQWRGHLTPDADAGASLLGAMTALHMLDHLTEAIIHSNQAGCETILDILTESHTASLRKIIIDKPVMHFSAPLIPVLGDWALQSRKFNEMKAALYSITLNDVEHPISISDAWAILSECPQLKELDVRVAGDAPSSALLPRDGLSSDLQVLKLDLDVSVSILFRNLSLPNLATLEMTFSDSNHIYAKNLDAALERWGCPLTYLLLRNSNLGEETLITCLKTVSSTLKDLLIYGAGPRPGCTIGKLALQRLTLQEGLNHNLCPKLQSLTLEPCVAPDGALAQLLSSKAPPLMCCGKIVPLRRVRVSFLKTVVPSMREVREEDLGMIRGLKATGMDIELVD
jgi:hypothetical protein